MGALTVCAFVSDAVCVIHGPSGCAHVNTSLIHTTLIEHDCVDLPPLLSSDLNEEEVIFGGEGALERTIDEALAGSPAAVFVLSTCIPETIGDDTEAVCVRYAEYGTPVIYVRTAGFLGGTFHDGYYAALEAVTELFEESDEQGMSVNLVGEKNLEYEVDENFKEIERLLGALGLSVNVRCVRNVSVSEIRGFRRARLNIVREDRYGTLCKFYEEKTGIPTISGFPVGPAETVSFLRKVGEMTGLDSAPAVEAEYALQASIAEDFADLRGRNVRFSSSVYTCPEASVVRDISCLAGLEISPDGTEIPLPFGMPVGTSGVRRIMHLWRRYLHE